MSDIATQYAVEETLYFLRIKKGATNIAAPALHLEEYVLYRFLWFS